MGHTGANGSSQAGHGVNLPWDKSLIKGSVPFILYPLSLSFIFPLSQDKGKIKGTLPLFFQALRAAQLKFDFSFSARIQAGILRRPISVVKKWPINHVLPDSTPSPTRNTSTTRACCRP